MFTVVSLFGSAQSLQVATLSHEGEITSFTTATALRDAYAAAVDGDVISLSPGTFTAVNFEKRITVRGAGMGIKVNDSDLYVEPTLLVGNFYIRADVANNKTFKLEGVVNENTVDLQGITLAQLSKCKFKNLSYTTSKGGFTQAVFIHCVVDGKAEICYNSSINFYGCYLKNAFFQENGSTNVLVNCILHRDDGDYFIERGCTVKNSIYINSTGIQNMVNRGNAYNSIWIGNHASNSSSFPFFRDLTAHNNTFVPEGVEVFKRGTFYQLTDQAKQYLGSDGTEVGLYGGTLPFDPTPTNPQITKFNVAPKTTADGKLSVDIEVNAK